MTRRTLRVGTLLLVSGLNRLSHAMPHRIFGDVEERERESEVRERGGCCRCLSPSLLRDTLSSKVRR